MYVCMSYLLVMKLYIYRFFLAIASTINFYAFNNQRKLLARYCLNFDLNNTTCASVNMFILLNVITYICFYAKYFSSEEIIISVIEVLSEAALTFNFLCNSSGK